MTKLVVIFLFLGSSVALAEESTCKTEDTSKPVQSHMEIVNGKRTMVIENPVIVCPHVPRPAVAYVTSPKDVAFEPLSLDQTFLPRIVETLKEAAFGGGLR